MKANNIQIIYLDYVEHDQNNLDKNIKKNKYWQKITLI